MTIMPKTSSGEVRTVIWGSTKTHERFKSHAIPFKNFEKALIHLMDFYDRNPDRWEVKPPTDSPKPRPVGVY